MSTKTKHSIFKQLLGALVGASIAFSLYHLYKNTHSEIAAFFLSRNSEEVAEVQKKAETEKASGESLAASVSWEPTKEERLQFKIAEYANRFGDGSNYVQVPVRAETLPQYPVDPNTGLPYYPDYYNQTSNSADSPDWIGRPYLVGNTYPEPQGLNPEVQGVTRSLDRPVTQDERTYYKATAYRDPEQHDLTVTPPDTSRYMVHVGAPREATQEERLQWKSLERNLPLPVSNQNKTSNYYYQNPTVTKQVSAVNSLESELLAQGNRPIAFDFNQQPLIMANSMQVPPPGYLSSSGPAEWLVAGLALLMTGFLFRRRLLGWLS